MSVMYTLLVAILDLAGVFFNIRMLRSCFKDGTKSIFLRKYRILTIFQCACQVTILVADAVETWKAGFEIQPRELCNVFRVLLNSTLFFQGCNLLAILIIYFDHPLAHGNRELCSKLKMLTALSLGLFGSAMIWCYSCFSQEFLSRMAILATFGVTVAFVVLLFVADAGKLSKDLEDPLEANTTQEATMETYPFLWKVCKEHWKPLFFMILLLVCLVVILSGSPQSPETEEVFFSFITRSVVGIILPVTLSYLIELSYEKEYDTKIVV